MAGLLGSAMANDDPRHTYGLVFIFSSSHTPRRLIVERARSSQLDVFVVGGNGSLYYATSLDGIDGAQLDGRRRPRHGVAPGGGRRQARASERRQGAAERSGRRRSGLRVWLGRRTTSLPVVVPIDLDGH
jgi:hypothetical protein